jgi:hypothetical protein
MHLQVLDISIEGEIAESLQAFCLLTLSLEVARVFDLEISGGDCISLEITPDTCSVEQ